jgi:hypothetical protein
VDGSGAVDGSRSGVGGVGFGLGLEVGVRAGLGVTVRGIFGVLLGAWLGGRLGGAAARPGTCRFAIAALTPAVAPVHNAAVNTMVAARLLGALTAQSPP